MLGAMRSHGSDSSDEPIRYTRRTPRPPGCSRNVALITSSSDESSDRHAVSARLRAGQPQVAAIRQPSGDLHAVAPGATGKRATDSIERLPDMSPKAAPPPTQQAAAHSAHVQQVACGTVTALSPTTVRMLSSPSTSNDGDAPPTFSCSVPRPRGRGLQATAAHLDSSSDDSPCATFRRSVPRRPQPNMLYDSDGVDTPPPTPARQHVLLALPAPKDLSPAVPGRPGPLIHAC